MVKKTLKTVEMWNDVRFSAENLIDLLTASLQFVPLLTSEFDLLINCNVFKPRAAWRLAKAAYLSHHTIGIVVIVVVIIVGVDAI